MNHSNKVSKKKKLPSLNARALRVMHPNAAGIDIGAREHYVAISPECASNPVRSFGPLTPDLHAMAQWLKEHEVDTVAMESTGVYWIPVARVLEHHGLEVYLVDARQLRNVSGRKTDVQDCQWIQQLHSFGLLSAAFRPTPAFEVLRSYWRQRERLIQSSAQQLHHMQHALEQMNVQLHKVLSDISGRTGMQIIRAIVAGERAPEVLVVFCHKNCKRPREDFIKALSGYYRQDHVFALQQAVELYDIYQEKCAALDQQLHRYLQTLQARSPKEKRPTPIERKPRSSYRRKNQPHFDLRAELLRITGVDLTQIDGIDAITAHTVISEQGIDMTRFPSEKHFASHLGLCPNNQITGGKIRKRKSRKVQSRAAKALRIAAQSLERNDSALGAFYRRMKGRHGPAKAITATAHKLAKIIYRMLKYGEEYVHKGQEDYEEKYKQQKVKSLLKHAHKMGYDLICVDTGEVLS